MKVKELLEELFCSHLAKVNFDGIQMMKAVSNSVGKEDLNSNKKDRNRENEGK